MANHASHSALPYPVKGARFTVLVPYLDADGDPTDPTTPDTERSLDGAAFADCAEEMTTITGANGMGYITLTGAETDCSMLALAAKVASGPKATLATLYPRQLVSIGTGTLSAGSAGGGTLGTVLAYDLSGCFIKTTGGTGGGGTGGANNQARQIATYNTSTGAFTVVPNWETTPDATTTYEVLLPVGVTLGMLRTLNPTTAGRTLLVESDGMAHADAREWLGGTIATPTTAGVPEVDVTHWKGSAAPDNTGDAFARLGAPAGASVSADIADIEGKVDDLESRVGTPANLGGGATLAQNLADIEAQTDDIGAAGAGLSAIPWNPTWDAEVQSEAADALTAYDPPTRAEVTSDKNEILAKIQGFVLESGTLGATGNDTTHVHLAALTYGDDEINNYLLVIHDVSEDEYHARYVEDWANVSKLATVATLPFTPQASTDGFFLLPFRQDVTGGAGLDAAGVRAAVGLTSANLDTQLGTIDSNVDAILADTGTDGVVVAAGSKSGYSLSLDQSGVIIGTVNALGVPARSQVNDEVDAALNTAIPGTPTADSINERVKAIDDKLPAGTLSDLTAAQVNTEVDTALADIHLDHLLAADYDPAAKPGTATALLNELVESDAGVSRFTANALEQAPSGGGASDWTATEREQLRYRLGIDGTESAPVTNTDLNLGVPSAGANADAVWDEATAGHTISGTFGEQVKTDVDAILANVTTALNRLGAFSGTGVNTILGFFQALFRKDALLTPTDVGGTFDNSTDSLEALKDNQLDAAVSTRATPAQVNAEVDTALADYDPPTRAELTADLAALNDLDAAGVRAAVGLAAADLDTQLDALPLVKAKTDNLPADPADQSAVEAAITAAQTALATAIGAVESDTQDLQARVPAALTAGGNMKSDMLAIDGDTTAADRLAEHAKGALKVIVAAGSTTTAVVLNATTGINGGAPSSTADFYNGAVLVFLTGALAGQRTSVSDYDGTTKTLTVVALTGAPAAGDTAILV